MRSKLVTFGTMAALLAPIAAVAVGAAGSGDVRVDAQPLRAGQKMSVVAKSEMTLAVDVKGNGKVLVQFEMPAHANLSFVASVDEADEEGCTKGALAFGKCECEETDTFGGKPRVWTPNYSSATIAATRDGGPLALHCGDVSLLPYEQEIVKSLATATLREPPLAAILRDHRLTIGTPIELGAEDGARVLHVLVSDAKVDSMTVTPDAVRKVGSRDAVVLKTTAKVSTSSNEGFHFEVSIDLSGEIVVARDGGQPLAMKLTGPVRMTGTMKEGDVKGELDGSGTWSIDWTAKLE
jgi:hypothetical protein